MQARSVKRFVATVLVMLPPVFAEAETTNEASFTPGWYLQGGVYFHYDEDNENYEGPPLFGGVEYFRSEKWLFGFAMFQNSFGQFSQYGYAGRVFHPWKSQPAVHIKITAGVVHGYKEPHHDTLPLLRYSSCQNQTVLVSTSHSSRLQGFCSSPGTASNDVTAGDAGSRPRIPMSRNWG